MMMHSDKQSEEGAALEHSNCSNLVLCYIHQNIVRAPDIRQLGHGWQPNVVNRNRSSGYQKGTEGARKVTRMRLSGCYCLGPVDAEDKHLLVMRDRAVLTPRFPPIINVVRHMLHHRLLLFIDIVVAVVGRVRIDAANIFCWVSSNDSVFWHILRSSLVAAELDAVLFPTHFGHHRPSTNDRAVANSHVRQHGGACTNENVVADLDQTRLHPALASTTHLRINACGRRQELDPRTNDCPVPNPDATAVLKIAVGRNENLLAQMDMVAVVAFERSFDESAVPDLADRTSMVLLVGL